MTEIDFYLLSDKDPTARHVFVCRLVEKVYALGKLVYINTSSDTEALALDELLWTFRQKSYIPHELAGQIDSSDCPVLVGGKDKTDISCQVLVNLDNELPALFNRFQRVLEVVNNNEDIRRAARRRFSFYKERGYPLRHHKISHLDTNGISQMRF